MSLLCRLLKGNLTWERCRIVLDIIGILAGLSMFVVLLVMYHNLQGGIWSCISAVFAAVLAHIHVLRCKSLIYSWYEVNELTKIAGLGVAGQFASLGGISAYVVAARVEEDAFETFATSYYMSMVWCAITFFWSLQLTLDCVSLRRSFPHHAQNQPRAFGAPRDPNAPGNWTAFPSPEGSPSPSLKRGPHTACLSQGRRWTTLSGTGDTESSLRPDSPPPLMASVT